MDVIDEIMTQMVCPLLMQASYFSNLMCFEIGGLWQMNSLKLQQGSRTNLAGMDWFVFAWFCWWTDKSMTLQVKEDPAFKPSGGRMGESDMDYDTDEKSMAALKRRLLKAQSSYYRYKR